MIGRALLHDLDLAKDLRTDLPDLALRSIAIVDQIISTDDLDTLWREVDRDEARLSRADLDLELAIAMLRRVRLGRSVRRSFVRSRS